MGMLTSYGHMVILLSLNKITDFLMILDLGMSLSKKILIMFSSHVWTIVMKEMGCQIQYVRILDVWEGP